MALTVPLTLLQFPGYFTDFDGNPLAGGKLQFYIAGTTTPKDTYADVNGDASNVNPVILDGNGFAVIFLQNDELYDVLVSDADDVFLYSVSGVGNPAAIVYTGFGNTWASGAKNVTSGYTVLDTDQLVTVNNGASAAVINLPAAATRSSDNLGNGLQLTIKNLGANTLDITPNGADTIEGIAAAYQLPAATSPLMPTVTLVSDGDSAWWIIGALGLG